MVAISDSFNKFVISVFDQTFSFKKFVGESSLIKLSSRKFGGQISFEFIVMFIVIMVAFLFFFGIFTEFNTVTYQNTQMDKAKAVAYSVANTVNAILPSENATVIIQIPHGYNISAGARSIIAQDLSGFTGSAPILTDRLNITLQENATNVTISKRSGIVYISGN